MSQEDGNEALKILAKGASIAFIGLILSKFFTYLFRVFIARYFGPGDYGLFSLGLAVLSFFSIFALLGMKSGVTRYIAYHITKKNEGGVKGVIKSSIEMVLPMSIVMLILMVILSPYIAINIFNEPNLLGVLYVLSLSLPFSAVISLFASVFIGFKKNKYQALTEEISINFSKLVLVIIIGIIGLGVVGIAWAWTIATILIFFMSAYFLKKVYPDIRSKVAAIPMKRELLSYSLPLLLTSSMGFLIIWTDTLMLGFFKTAIDVGIYNAALPTAQLLFLFPNAIAVLFLPIITELYTKKSKGELNRVYKTVTRWTFYVNFPLFLLMVFFSSQILNLIFGPEYVGGYMVLIIISIGFMSKKSIPVVNVLEMLKKTKYIFLLSILTATLNVVLNFILIPPYGMTGAAVASMITYIVGIITFLAASYYFTRMNPFSKSMGKSVIAGILAVVVVYSCGRFLFTEFSVYVLALLFVVFVLIYGFILLLLKGFSREDIEIMKTIERKSGLRFNFLRNIIKRFI